jgi:hypothetical protein
LQDRVAFIQRQLAPMRTAFLSEAVRSLEFGWRPFEKVWDVQEGAVVIKQLKPLLPDFTFVQIDPAGHYAGIEQLGVQLEPDKAFVCTHDGEAGNPYGRSRHESARHAWWNWNQTDERTAQLTTKIAAIIPMVHYPVGQGRDASGTVRDNGELADTILAGLGSGRGVKLPNLFANTDDPRLSATLAGQSAWVISFLEASSAATNLGGLTDRQRYYDALMFRAWLRPERAGLESKYGSRADAAEHSEAALTDGELIHADLCDQLNRGVVDELLTYNFGEEARGSVFISPAPLQKAKRDVMQKFLEAAWRNPGTLARFTSQIDMDAVFDEMSLPKARV